MRNFGIREADLTALGITMTEEINPSAINTKWETAITHAVMMRDLTGTLAGRLAELQPMTVERMRVKMTIDTTYARDRLLRTMEICGHIPRWEPPVIQAAPAPTPVIQPPQAAPAPPAAPAPQAAQAPPAAPAPQAAQAPPAAPVRQLGPFTPGYVPFISADVERRLAAAGPWVTNPLTGRRIRKRGALYKKLQRQGKIPEDPQTPQQRRQDMGRAWRAAHAQGTGITWEQWRREYDLSFEPATPEQRRLRVEAAAAGALARLEAQRTAAREQRPTEQPTEPCAICMDDTYTDPLRLRECGHTYCYECIKHWHTSRHGRAKCPTCRTDIQRNPALA
jgi:hypothetical protein